jgi:hypothetical protein
MDKLKPEMCLQRKGNAGTSATVPMWSLSNDQKMLQSASVQNPAELEFGRGRIDIHFWCWCRRYLQGLGASDCKTEFSRRNILAGSGPDQTVQRTLVAE